MNALLKNVGEFTKKNSPAILTGLGVAGMVTTVIFSCKGTLKAERLLEDLEHTDMDEKDIRTEKLKIYGKAYWPTLVMGTISIVCVISANSLNARRNLALASAYSISETALREYQSKVEEAFGAGKARKIKDEILQEHVMAHPKGDSQVIIKDKNDVLCYDNVSGRYFMSTRDKLNTVENIINKKLLNNDYISLNVLYEELGLDSLKIGDDLGWDIMKGMIEFEYSSQLTKDGEPCLVLDYRIEPVIDVWGAWRN